MAYSNPWGRLWPGSTVGTTYNMTLQDVIDWGYDLGLADYPIWDESYRETLNGLIVDHFRLREIRGETPAMFVWLLNRQMNENMGQISLVFQAVEGLTPDALRKTTDLQTTGNSSGTNDSSANVTANGLTYNSTNPRETMVGRDPSEYYDSGVATTSNSTTENKATTGNDTKGTTTGYSSSDLVDVLTRWTMGPTNPLQLVFAVCEPCFSQLKTTHLGTMW